MKDSADGDQQDISFYYTISKPSAAELKVKGSRFIALAFPVTTLSECENILQQQRRNHHAATHICFAYRIGLGERTLSRQSDAGEPAGTAGPPIFLAITGRKLTNVLVVVVRYFGGTKLGIGGLIRAYGESAARALDAAGRIRKEVVSILQLRFSYNLLQPVMREISARKGRVIHQKYTDRVQMSVAVPVPAAEQLRRNLVNITSGKIEVLAENQTLTL